MALTIVADKSERGKHFGKHGFTFFYFEFGRQALRGVLPPLGVWRLCSTSIIVLR